MEIVFRKVSKIKIDTVKNPGRADATWLKILVTDNEGEHEINCFPANDKMVPISMYAGEDDD